MKTKLIMIRHGHSIANQQNRFAGHSDFDLTDIGRQQAQMCAEALKDQHIDVLYASDLKRAYNTGATIAKAVGLEAIPTKKLREIFAGKWEGLTFYEIDEKYREDFLVWRNDIGKATCTGGEQVKELYERIIDAMKEIAAENEGKTVCIATHATPIRSVCTASAGLGSEDMVKVEWVGNASISIFEYEDGKFIPIDIGNTDHLGDFTTKLPSNV